MRPTSNHFWRQQRKVSVVRRVVLLLLYDSNVNIFFRDDGNNTACMHRSMGFVSSEMEERMLNG